MKLSTYWNLFIYLLRIQILIIKTFNYNILS